MCGMDAKDITKMAILEHRERKAKAHMAELEAEQSRQLGQMMAISNACSGGSQDVAEGDSDWSPQLDLVRYLSGTVERLEAELITESERRRRAIGERDRAYEAIERAEAAIANQAIDWGDELVQRVYRTNKCIQQDNASLRDRVTKLEAGRARGLECCSVLDEVADRPERAQIAASVAAIRTALDQGEKGESDGS